MSSSSASCSCAISANSASSLFFVSGCFLRVPFFERTAFECGIGPHQLNGIFRANNLRDFLDRAGHPLDMPQQATDKGTGSIDHTASRLHIAVAAHLYGDPVAKIDGLILRLHPRDLGALR